MAKYKESENGCSSKETRPRVCQRERHNLQTVVILILRNIRARAILKRERRKLSCRLLIFFNAPERFFILFPTPFSLPFCRVSSLKRSHFKPALHSFCCTRKKRTRKAHTQHKKTTTTSWRLNSRTSKSPNSKKRSLCSIKTATGPSPRKSSVRFNFWSIFPSFALDSSGKRRSTISLFLMTTTTVAVRRSRRAKSVRRENEAVLLPLSRALFFRERKRTTERESTQRSAFPVAFLEVISPL